MINLRFHILYAVFIGALLGCQNPQEQTNFKNSPSAAAGSLYPSQWQSSSSFPLHLKAGLDFSEDEINSLEDAATEWNQTNSAQIDFFNVSRSTKSGYSNFDDYKDGELGIYKVFEWPADMPATALAVTQIFGKKSSNGKIIIYHADILMNYDYFDFSINNNWGYDLHTVVLHELGHFLGLYHENTSAEESVMFPTISKYRHNRTPHPHDEDNLVAKYGRAGAASMSTQPNQIDVKISLELHSSGEERFQIRSLD